MTKKKRIILILTILIPLILILIVANSIFVGSKVVQNSTHQVTNEETREVEEGFWEKYGMDLNEFRKKYTIETFRLTSGQEDGHIVPGELIYKGTKKPDTVIMVHGMGSNRQNNYPIAELFLENDFNVITYDQRCTNENNAETTTFGYLEKFDLIDCVKYAKENTAARTIGVWGTSYGGATAVQAVAYKDTQVDISFMILDCPVSSMEWMVRHQIDSMGIGIPTGYMVFCGNLMNRFKLGFSYDDADSAEAAKNISVPTFVINSESDTTTPVFMGNDIYNNINTGNKEIWTVYDSEHTNQWLEHNLEYRNKVTDFIKRYRK